MTVWSELIALARELNDTIMLDTDLERQQRDYLVNPRTVLLFVTAGCTYSLLLRVLSRTYGVCTITAESTSATASTRTFTPRTYICQRECRMFMF